MDELVCGSCHGRLVAKSAACPLCGEDPRVHARYWLERVLGAGASGTTFLASLDASGAPQQVAIKELSVRALHSFKALELFERETAILKSLRHRAIPAYVEHFHVQSGKQVSLYLVQEFIQGQTLEDELKAKRFDEAQLLAMLEELLDVLDYLHQCSPAVIHRDIKPSNIMRRQDGSLALIDFGAVREVVKDPDLGGSTVAGTFGYMAPEQFAGIALPATDLYGLGVTLLTLLTRRQPQELLDAHHVLQWRPHVKASERLTRILALLLEPDYKLRPASVAQVREQLLRSAPRGASVPVQLNAAPPQLNAAPLVRASPSSSADGEQYAQAQLFKWLSKRFALMHPKLEIDALMRQRLRDVSVEVVAKLWRGQDAEVNLPFFTANAQGPIHFQLMLGPKDLEHIVHVDDGFELERYQPISSSQRGGELMVRPHAGALVRPKAQRTAFGAVLVITITLFILTSLLSLALFFVFLL